jgi:3-hydroxymyristoyl/3-hydroxydecanoyl-(acyl carrier protein) dehydratase
MRDTRTLHISAQHPAFEGHFPGTPLLPGVLLLDEVLHAVMESGCCARDLPELRWTISAAKFLRPVRPGETLTLEHEALANGSIRFTLRGPDQPVASGTLVPVNAAEPNNGHEVR